MGNNIPTFNLVHDYHKRTTTDNGGATVTNSFTVTEKGVYIVVLVAGSFNGSRTITIKLNDVNIDFLSSGNIGLHYYTYGQYRKSNGLVCESGDVISYTCENAGFMDCTIYGIYL